MREGDERGEENEREGKGREEDNEGRRALRGCGYTYIAYLTREAFSE